MDSTDSVELMSLTELCDHLEYARQVTLQIELERLDRLTRSAAQLNCEEGSRLLEIRNIFLTFHNQFVAHLRQETNDLFPFVRQMIASKNGVRPLRSSLKSRVARLRNDHNHTGETLADLRDLIDDRRFELPASQTIRLISKSIVRLDKAVQAQIYKENQVLFPRILAFGNQG